MQVSMMIALGMMIALPSLCIGNDDGVYNRRNRRGAQLRTINFSKNDAESVQSAEIPDESTIFMPAVFDRPYPEEKKIQQNKPPIAKQSKDLSENVKKEQTEKKAQIYANDPTIFGVDQNVFYEELSGECRQVFDQMDLQGKGLALRLSIPYQDPNQAVVDAYFEMQRRNQLVNSRKGRNQYKRSKRITIQQKKS